MDRTNVVAAILASAAAVQASAEAIATTVRTVANSQLDGRSFRTPRQRQFTIRRTQFTIAEQNESCNAAWYFDQFRCTRSSFDKVVNMIAQHWEAANSPIKWNAHFSIRWRVAVALHYFTHAGSIVESANAFGMSKSSAWRYIDQILRVLIDAIGPWAVRMPQSLEEWEQMSEGFEAVCGFPDTCLAIDGVLFEIERPSDYEGWYCRKGFPAINALVAVDHEGKIRDFALRPGSENDKGVYNRSVFGSTIASLLPRGKVVVADAGYQLFVHCMTPYEENSCDKTEKLYNYLHSKTRIKVEQTFGRLKNRFRIFKAPLAQKGNVNNGDREENEIKHGYQQAARIIRGCFVLHNIFTDLHDSIEPDLNIDEAIIHDGPVQAIPGEAAKARRDAIKNYLSAMHNSNE
jgi:hypothetical protein